MAEIKNIVFDLGAVLLNIDYNRTRSAFIDLGYTDFDKMYSQARGNDFFDRLETGHLPDAAFYEYVLSIGNGKVTQEQVMHAWNSMLLDFRGESLNFLKQLSSKYKLFLLSNTNAIHKEVFEIILQKQTGAASLDTYFTKAYFSHLVGMRKPNEDIFRFVLSDAGIIAEETLFIDDLDKNIEAARKLGFKTHQLLPGEKIEELHYY
jgi:putative hydrolase of the HAD superfamily